MNREQILEVYHQGPEAVESFVFSIVEAYKQRIQEMKVKMYSLIPDLTIVILP
ncbi:hypothetical protein H9I32_20750 [Bacillus sp. Xin]|uniref:hypothetical protein n=1 Tax=unclassified Bacillus (in: firmicutes) TaxID=185979 RepID=UPI001573F11A|nr:MULTISPECIES: hypothetical protein [unclassified Bacillus (in: firmicutes)]MBC6974729.1 hypothetical protein [Bacillus sp. Xin]NSW34485.1 hypothetical protein [Bacillus sp. Xin1]